MDFIKRELASLRRSGLLRQFKTISAIDGARVKINGRWYISFCSNDYLGLSQHPALRRAAKAAIDRFGVGSGASRLMAGTFSLHRQLEKAIARFKGAEDALLFTSGYAANLGVITALVKKSDTLFCDELNHASLIDAARLTGVATAESRPYRRGARLFIYRHRDMEHLKTLLKAKIRNLGASAPVRATNVGAQFYIVSDAVFSMDGDIAPLKEIAALAGKYKATVILDEAHSTGIFGRNGRGLLDELGLRDNLCNLWLGIGTLSKAVGGLGGFVTGSKEMISYIRSKSRPFIFTTALPPAVCAANIAALKIIRQQPQLHKKLWANTDYIKSLLNQLNPLNPVVSETPIIPVVIGDAKKTLQVSQYLWSKGLFIPAIRPPTVPVGQSRLRISISALHRPEHLDALSNHLLTFIRNP
ncbi:MAG: 8-amino-7-oxononanoate synthase [Planctomycetes bacterium]|nr:8-amino-7-oxononanoate synthase [Planctomycetota bacterium]